jgi:hypothetical protein
MKPAYSYWLFKSHMGDKLPRGKHFKREQQHKKILNHLLHHAHYMYLDRIESAFQHYFDIADNKRVILSTHPDDLAQDRIKFKYLIKVDTNGNSVLSIIKCAQFMESEWHIGFEEAITFACLYWPD